MKPTPITFIPAETYKALIKEAANRCIRVGCSIDDAVDNIQIIEKELAKKEHQGSQKNQNFLRCESTFVNYLFNK